MVSHIITEEDLKHVCLYCKNELPIETNWNSSFSGSIHYKSTTCSCGHDIDIKVTFQGSGHDSWANINSLESKKKKNKEENKGLDKVVQENIKNN